MPNFTENFKIFIIFFILFSHPLKARIYNDTIDQVMYAKYDKNTHLNFLNLDIVKNESILKELSKELIKNEDYHLYTGDKQKKIKHYFFKKGPKKIINKKFNNRLEPINNPKWNFSSKFVRK